MYEAFWSLKNIFKLAPKLSEIRRQKKNISNLAPFFERTGLEGLKG
jgi:hypothetical protein